MFFILYFIRILPQKCSKISRNGSYLNPNAQSFVCGWGPAPDPVVGAHIDPTPPSLSTEGKRKEREGDERRGGKGKGRGGLQSL